MSISTSSSDSNHPTMPRQAIEQLDHSISEVFALMLNRDCSPSEHGPPLTIENALQPALALAANHDPGILASISFSGSMRGACSVHLPLRTAAAITGELVGPMPEAEAATLNADTAGEICNMIAGNWKSRQPDPYARCQISTPHITHAEPAPPTQRANQTGSQPTFRNVLVRTYTFEDHCLHLQLAFD